MALTKQQILKATEPVVYIARRDGVVSCVWSLPNPEATEALFESDPEVKAHRERPLPERTPLQKLEAATGLTLTQIKGVLAGGK